MDKRLRELKKLADKYGRKVEQTKNSHYRLVDKKGRKPAIIASVSPSDYRSMKNAEAMMKREMGSGG